MLRGLWDLLDTLLDICLLTESSNIEQTRKITFFYYTGKVLLTLISFGLVRIQALHDESSTTHHISARHAEILGITFWVITLAFTIYGFQAA